MSSEGVELSVAMVTGDDMMKSVSERIFFPSYCFYCYYVVQLKETKDGGYAVDIESGRTLPSSILSMNAYIG